MAEFFTANLGTIITALMVLAIATEIVIKLIKAKRAGTCCSCGCGCPKRTDRD
jgi:hypothetical protein